MKQVFLSGKGAIEVFEVPVPGRMSKSILVRNAYTLISTGTEGAAVSRRGGWLGAVEKAMHSRDRVQQVWQLAQTQGLPKTWEMVRRKLDDYVAPGYSCAGQVVEVADGVTGFQPGDLVACMGAGFATHSEYVVVPVNLAVRMPHGIDCSEAAFAALACIAMQGIRRLELSPCEYIGVVGLGLIGQITARMLVALGYRVVGIDLSPQRAAKARECPGVDAWSSEELDSSFRVNELTGGYGLDGVIICAATQSDQPVNLAFDLCRKRGRVVVVGDVGLGLERDRMYQKEIELRVASSYGPGRYDDNYELAGHDYPIGYVRWTENRNLQSFLELLKSGRLSLGSLISARFPVEEAATAYAEIKQGNPDTYGVLFNYGPLPHQPEPLIAAAHTLRLPTPTLIGKDQKIRIGIIGVGGYAKNVHIPNLRNLADRYTIRGLSSRSGATAAIVARSTGALIATSDYRELLGDPQIDAVLISTRHASHAKIALDALAAGKHVFVEKPMTTTVEDGEAIVAKASEVGCIVRVGFNRRFSPYMSAMRKAVGPLGLRMFTCRVNIGAIKNDWSNTSEEGGRLLGEGVHFFDLCNWFIGAEPISLSASVAGPIEVTNPNVMVQLRYPDGSLAQVTYTTLGQVSMGKEYFEAFGNGRAVRSEEFQSIDAFGASASVPRSKRGDKGQVSALEEFAAAVQGKSYPIQGADARAGLVATWMTSIVYESARLGTAMQLQSSVPLREPA